MLLEILPPIGQSLIFVFLISIIREPYRQRSMAIMLALAGGVYINNAYQLMPEIFALVIAIFSLLGLKNYKFIGIGWLLHSAYDWIHYTNGFPMINHAPGSAFGCAIFDIGIAVYFFFNAPNLLSIIKSKIFQTTKL